MANDTKTKSVNTSTSETKQAPVSIPAELMNDPLALKKWLNEQMAVVDTKLEGQAERRQQVIFILREADTALSTELLTLLGGQKVSGVKGAGEALSKKADVKAIVRKVQAYIERQLNDAGV